MEREERVGEERGNDRRGKKREVRRGERREVKKGIRRKK